ncbi:MAG: ribosome rescue GTPase HflX [Gammaproteobacteria bacterium]
MERPPHGEKAVLVHVADRAPGAMDGLGEFRELLRSAGLRVEASVKAKPESLDPKHLLGRGKAEEVRVAAAACSARVVAIDHPLTPSQERNLEQVLACKVIDRTGVILEIFAQRAQSFEGKLQVELARMHYLATRLVRGWTHLERQTGGIGLRGGPGETQLESDRRLIRNRIRQLTAQLKHVRQQRSLSRRARRRAHLPTVLLVGYTNAGKSTLFNRLSGAAAYTDDRLFATLDPTLRRIIVPGFGIALLGDTVGFIRDLPHELVAAFRATLEEVREASLLLHVIDASLERAPRSLQIDQVQRVIAQIGAAQVPVLEVYNKIDSLPDTAAQVAYDAQGNSERVWISAARRQGLELVSTAIAQRLQPARVRRWVRLPASAGRLRARLYAQQAVRAERCDQRGGWLVEVETSAANFRQPFEELVEGSHAPQ